MFVNHQQSPTQTYIPAESPNRDVYRIYDCDLHSGYRVCPDISNKYRTHYALGNIDTSDQSDLYVHQCDTYLCLIDRK